MLYSIAASRLAHTTFVEARRRFARAVARRRRAGRPTAGACIQAIARTTGPMTSKTTIRETAAAAAQEALFAESPHQRGAGTGNRSRA
jgi:hypothetical protein